MKLIVGLGNVGEAHQKNRHNVGFMVIDKIVEKLMISPHVEKKWESLVFYHRESASIFARPQTMMNSSGEIVKKLVDFYKVGLDDLFVVHDDLDIALGEHKIQKGKGPKEHKGLISIYEKIGKSGFWHVRVGVDNRDPENRISGEEYVLQNFAEEELDILSAVIDRVVKDLIDLLE